MCPWPIKVDAATASENHMSIHSSVHHGALYVEYMSDLIITTSDHQAMASQVTGWHRGLTHHFSIFYSNTYWVTCQIQEIGGMQCVMRQWPCNCTNNISAQNVMLTLKHWYGKKVVEKFYFYLKIAIFNLRAFKYHRALLQPCPRFSSHTSTYWHVIKYII